MAGSDPVTQIPDVIALIPAFPYKTERFSNGRRTWIEILADAVGLGSSVKPAVAGALFGQDDGKASNYAVGGSTASPGLSPVPLGLQVVLFLGDVGGQVPSNALVVMAIGGNDIRAALAAADPIAVINQAVDSIEQSIVALHGAGARKFLVWNVPDVGSTPAMQRLNALAIPGIAGSATFLSEVYNGILSARLQALGGLPAIDIVPFNLFVNLHAIQEDPRRFRLADATTACIEPDVPTFGFPSSAPFRCAPQDRQFFWDGIHPTRAGHRIIADLVAKELGAELVLDD
jgi:phospholipase/lecithinase/hemolysin